MIDYIDPAPHIRRFLRAELGTQDFRIVNGVFAPGEEGPALSIKLAGGAPDAIEPYSRLQLMARDSVDYVATSIVIKACNALARNYHLIQVLRVKSVRIESRPIDSRDSDTGKPESWVYVIIEHMEA